MTQFLFIYNEIIKALHMLSHNISFGRLIKCFLIFANSVQSVERISRAFAANAIINTLSAWFLVQLQFVHLLLLLVRFRCWVGVYILWTFFSIAVSRSLAVKQKANISAIGGDFFHFAAGHCNLQRATCNCCTCCALLEFSFSFIFFFFYFFHFILLTSSVWLHGTAMECCSWSVATVVVGSQRQLQHPQHPHMWHGTARPDQVSLSLCIWAFFLFGSEQALLLFIDALLCAIFVCQPDGGRS